MYRSIYLASKTKVSKFLLLFILLLASSSATFAQNYIALHDDNPDIASSYPTGQNFELRFVHINGNLGLFNTYSLSSGALPPGLSIRTDAVYYGYVEGRPTVAGRYTFKLQRNTNVDGIGYSDDITINVVAGNQPYQNYMIDLTKTLSDTPFALGASIGDSPMVTYSSSDQSVASISGTGQITMLKAGKTNITVSTPATINYLESTKTVELTVTKAPLSLTLAGDTKTYTGNSISIPSATLSGVVGGANLPIIYSYTGTGYGPSTTPPTGVGTYTVTASVAGDANHTAPADAAATLTITKATPQIQLTAKNTAYTGSPIAIDAPVITGSFTVGSLAVTYSYSGTGYPASATPPTAVGTYSVTVSIAGDNNHNSNSATTTLSIGKQTPELTLTGGSKIYDGTPYSIAATIVPSHLSVTYSYAGTLKDGTAYAATPQTPTDAGDYTLTASTQGDDNYGMATVAVQLEIAKKQAAITLENKSTPYSGLPIAIDAPITEPTDAVVTITYTGTGATTYTESPTAPKNGGTYSVKAVFAGNNNYTAATQTASLTIADAGGPTLQLDNRTVVYNGTPQTIGTAVISPEAAKYLTVTYTYSSADYAATTTPPTNAGTYSVAATTPADGNYTAGLVTASLTIERAPQVITFEPLATKPLGDAPFSCNATVATSLPLTYQSGNSEIATVDATGMITILRSGSVTITVSQAGDANHLPANKSQTLTITSSDATLHKITVGGTQLTLTDNMFFDMGSATDAQLSVALEAETNATVNTGLAFNVAMDKPQLKTVTITVTSQDGSQTKTYTLVIEKRFSFDQIVKMRWNNTMTVINAPDNNGGYTFKTITWYRNGEQVGTEQSWSAGANGEAINPTDRFSVAVTSEQFEGTLHSAETTIALLNVQFTASKSVVPRGETLTLNIDASEDLLKGAFVEMYNGAGNLVTRLKVQGGETPVPLQPAAGKYTFKIKGEGGLNKDVNVEYK